MAELLYEAFLQRSERGAVLQLCEVERLLFVDVFVHALSPQRVPARYHFVHYQPSRPNVHRFAIRLPTSHLLRRLVNKSPTTPFDALLCFILDRQAKVNEFDVSVSL